MPLASYARRRKVKLDFLPPRRHLCQHTVSRLSPHMWAATLVPAETSLALTRGASTTDGPTSPTGRNSTLQSLVQTSHVETPTASSCAATRCLSTTTSTSPATMNAESTEATGMNAGTTQAVLAVSPARITRATTSSALSSASSKQNMKMSERRTISIARAGCIIAASAASKSCGPRDFSSVRVSLSFVSAHCSRCQTTSNNVCIRVCVCIYNHPKP